MEARLPSPFFIIMQKAAFFDIDGTLTNENVWRGLMAYFKTHKKRRLAHLAFLAVHYPLYFIRRAGLISESNFRAPWAAHLAWYLRGYTLEEAETVWDWVVTQFLPPYWRADTLAILQEHLQNGDLVMLVSSGPAPLVRAIARHLGAPHAVGTEFSLKDGKYDGGVSGEVCIDQLKAEHARQYLSRHGLDVDFESSHSYADSSSDEAVLAMAGNPVAVYPDAGLQKLAAERGWKVFPPAG
jgi:HAD superfamily hydrolase (TIGR01490 family)